MPQGRLLLHRLLRLEEAGEATLGADEGHGSFCLRKSVKCKAAHLFIHFVLIVLLPPLHWIQVCFGLVDVVWKSLFASKLPLVDLFLLTGFINKILGIFSIKVLNMRIDGLPLKGFFLCVCWFAELLLNKNSSHRYSTRRERPGCCVFRAQRCLVYMTGNRKMLQTNMTYCSKLFPEKKTQLHFQKKGFVFPVLSSGLTLTLSRMQSANQSHIILKVTWHTW